MFNYLINIFNFKIACFLVGCWYSVLVILIWLLWPESFQGFRYLQL